MGRFVENYKTLQRSLNRECRILLDGDSMLKPSNQIGVYSELDLQKSKHRSADSKYRSKVQFMYSKLKEITQVKTTKDSLLNDALKFIIKKEKQLNKQLGKRSLEELQKDFLRFLRHEEKLWKTEKDVNKWWNAVETSLNHKHSSDDLHWPPVFDENDGFDKICRIHDEEWANKPSEDNITLDSKPSLKKQKRKQLLMPPENNDPISYDDYLNPMLKNNRFNSVYMPNSICSSNNLPLKGNEDQYHTDAYNELMMTDLGFFTIDKPLELCKLKSLSEAGLHNSANHVSSTLISL